LSKPTTFAWIVGLAAGIGAGLAAHELVPATFADWTPIAWGIGGGLLPFALLHFEEAATKNVVVFLSTLCFASPWIPVWLVMLLGMLVALVFMVRTSGK
jgi:hypothetical protein